MSKYTTGEIAKLCGVSVRTVQYYDTRGILVPSELSEGGRRLYNEEDLGRMKVICFLREIGFSINNIAAVLAEENPSELVGLLIEQQEEILRSEVEERREKLDKLVQMRRELKDKDFSVEYIGDIAQRMENRKKLRKVIALMLITALPISVLQVGSIILWIKTGIWWPFALYWVVGIPWGIWISRYYYKHVAYICPHCHELFKPKFKEMFWANHTPKTRKLRCPKCDKKSFCLEVYYEQD